MFEMAAQRSCRGVDRRFADIRRWQSDRWSAPGGGTGYSENWRDVCKASRKRLRGYGLSAVAFHVRQSAQRRPGREERIMYQRILVPVDDSDTSRQALLETNRFCCEQRGKTRLVHVIDLAQFTWGGAEFVDVGELQSNLRENGKKVLDAAAALLRESGIEVETSLVEVWGGHISNAIISEAQTWGADIIVMGSHGWTGLDHLLLGSVAEGVVRHTPKPVLIFPIKRQK
jgi:nucleotide-binding universal stress UspA family protein